jgi:predicted amidohydrolase
MSVKFKFDEELAVGIIQTTVNAELAWPKSATKPRMSSAQDAHAWQEICKAMRALKDGDVAPKIVILPELSLPRTRLVDFEKLVCALNVIAFVGVDYRLNPTTSQARNEGLVFVPAGFWRGRPSRTCTRIIFGKSHAAPGERFKLGRLRPAWTHAGDDKVYIFDAEKYGNIGVSICYDFMDLERAVMYRGRVHHLFVLAYNRDLGMFRSLADSLSRTVFCNVIVCNTGFYGGSIAVSPYHDPHKRLLYSHDGNGLFTTQVVKLPVRGVVQALGGKVEKKTVKRHEEKVFKDRPPGVGESANLTLVTETLNPPPS